MNARIFRFSVAILCLPAIFGGVAVDPTSAFQHLQTGAKPIAADEDQMSPPRVFQPVSDFGCPTADGVTVATATPIAGTSLAEGVPAGITFSLLTEGTATTSIPGSALMLVERATLEPGDDSGEWQALGPVLLYVVSGSLTAIVNEEEQPLASGGSAIIQMGDYYALLNTSSAPATLLALSASVNDIDSGRLTSPPARRYNQALPEPQVLPGLNTEILFSRMTQSLPVGPMRLFLACTSWHESIDEPYQHAGPIGIRMESGTLRVNGESTYTTDDCFLIEANATHVDEPALDAPSGDASELPRALIFGLLPEGQPLWQPGVGQPLDTAAAWGCEDWA